MRESLNEFWARIVTICQVLLTCRSIEQHVKFVCRFVSYRDHNISIHNVLNKRNVLVTNSLNVVLTKTVFQHGWALKCFNSNNARAVNIFQTVTSCNSAARTSGRRKRCKTNIGMSICLHMFEGMCQSASSDFVVANMVSEFAELIQDEVAWVFGHFITGVVDLFHVAFGTRSTHNVVLVNNPLIKPVKTLL